MHKIESAYQCQLCMESNKCPSSRFRAIWTKYNETVILQCKEKAFHERLVDEFQTHFWVAIRLAFTIFLKLLITLLICLVLIRIVFVLIKYIRRIYMKYIRPGHVEVPPVFQV